MGVKRKQHSADFKARVAMAALSGEKTLAELSSEFGVHPTMISTWKQELMKRAVELFARGSKAPAAADAQKTIDDLHRKIGQLQVERDGLPPEEWRVEIRASCGHGDADLGHVRPCLNGRSVANPRMQALPIIEDLDVIEHRCFGFLAGSEAAFVNVFFLE